MGSCYGSGDRGRCVVISSDRGVNGGVRDRGGSRRTLSEQRDLRRAFQSAIFLLRKSRARSGGRARPVPLLQVFDRAAAVPPHSVYGNGAKVRAFTQQKRTLGPYNYSETCVPSFPDCTFRPGMRKKSCRSCRDLGGRIDSRLARRTATRAFNRGVSQSVGSPGAFSATFSIEGTPRVYRV